MLPGLCSSASQVARKAECNIIFHQKIFTMMYFFKMLKEDFRHAGITKREFVVYGLGLPALLFVLCLAAEYINNL